MRNIFDICRGSLYIYNLENENLQRIGNEDVGITGITISPKNEILYFQRDAWGPHEVTWALHKVNIYNLFL